MLTGDVTVVIVTYVKFPKTRLTYLLYHTMIYSFGS